MTATFSSALVGMGDDPCNLGSRRAVAERIVRARHGGIGLLSSKSLNISVTMRVRSVPTSFAVPAAMPSGRSVVSRMTSTGLPNEGASSCTPPLSVSTISAMSSKRTKWG
jgi:hypothetical protein